MFNISLPASELLREEDKLVKSDEAVVIENLVTDSRKVNEGDWFICLKGEKFDGHDFIHALVKKNAGGFIFSRPEIDVNGILVPDTNVYLGHIARVYRKKINRGISNRGIVNRRIDNRCIYCRQCSHI